MNKSEFIQLIQDPDKITSAHIEQLEELIANFPYCQSAYILLAKIASDTGSMLSPQRLSKAAAYTVDRKNLKRIIQGKHISSTENIKIVNEPVYAVVIEEQISESVPILDKEPTIEDEIEIQNKEYKEKEILNKVTDKEKFFLELQENLNKLRDLKKHAAQLDKENQIAKEKSPEIITKTNVIHEEKPHEHTAENIDAGKETLEKEKVYVRLNVTNSTLLSSRLDEILIDKDLDGNATSSLDFMIEYLHFLGTKRNNFMRDKNKMGELIDKFIKENPGMPSMANAKNSPVQHDLAAEILRTSKTPVSENFAKILVSQGKIQKATEVYKELILKNPEKRAYFESKIEEIINK